MAVAVPRGIENKTGGRSHFVDLEDFHFVLWGEPEGNRWIRKFVSDSPLGWADSNWIVDGQRYSASTHVPALIYPSPWSVDRYVVLNSGPTFRESHDRRNSLQNPKLPDWAVFDLSQPPDDVSAGAVEASGFFDERWQFQ